MNEDADKDRESLVASLTPEERQYLFETFQIRLDATSIDTVPLQVVVVHRRIKQIEAEALQKLRQPPHSDPSATDVD